MKYRALITLDWGRPHDNNARHTLIAALMDAGWNLAETTAFTIETEDLNKVWRGVGLVATVPQVRLANAPHRRRSIVRRKTQRGTNGSAVT